MSERMLSGSSHVKLDRLTESDIDNLWLNMQKTSTQGKGSSRRKNNKPDHSLDTTPTTDYSEGFFPLYPETLDEELEQDKKSNHRNTVLRAKRLKPKSYLSQVILYDNVSHDRLLSMRLSEIHHSHHMAEKRAKRRHESFVKSLERKEQEWERRDARIIAKLEPANVSELNFSFGRLYTKPDYPYQSLTEKWSGGQHSARALDHARRRPKILPQVTNRPIYDDEEPEDKTFITKLPKLKTQPPTIHEDIYFPDEIHQDLANSAIHTNDRYVQRGRRRRRRQKGKNSKDWIADMRFHTLTDMLSERYSPKESLPVKEHGADKASIISGTI